jgi:hypothetical protein
MRRVEVGDIQVLGQLSAMQHFIKLIVEVQANNIKLGKRRFLLSEYNTTIDVMEVVVITVVGLDRKPAIVKGDIL